MPLSPAARSAFRACDIRGRTGPGFDAAFVREMGRACGTLLLRQGVRPGRNIRDVVVARDCRLSSPSFHRALIEGLCSAGLDVIDLGLAPTPCLYFAVLCLKREAGVMVTASHNPPEDNGLKIWLGEGTAGEKDLLSIRNILERGDYEQGTGMSSSFDVTPSYIEDIVRRLGSCRPFRVVLDGGNGAAGKICALVLRRLGAEVEELFCEPDGRFPHHPPDPVREENLTALRAAVRETRADLGLGLDGDGDRIAVMDERGRLLMGDELLALFARDLLTREQGARVLGDVKCSARLFDDVAARGGVPGMCRSGHSLVRAALREQGALLAGELSGHIFHRENWYGFDDATYCAARLLCILSRLGEPLSALPGWPRAWITPELNLPCPDHLKFRVVEKALRWYRERFPVCDLDGARIDFGGAWGLIRASNTSPSLSMRFEADSPERMESLRAQAERLARQWMEECAGEQAGSGTACPGDRKPSCRASCTDTGRIFRKTEKNA